MALSLVDKAKQYFTSKSQDNEGWFRQGKFTPLQQIGSQINYQKQVSPINRALYTGLETASRPVVNSLANIGALGTTGLGSLQMAMNRPQAAQKSFNTALNLRNFAGTQGSFDQGTGWNTVKKGGIDAVQTALTGKGLKYVNPANLGISGFLGGTMSKLGGGDFATGAGRAMGTVPSIMGAVGVSNPLLAKIMPAKASPLVSRVTGGFLNVAQGVGINASQGTPNTPASMGLDLLTGIAGGRNQFNMGTNFSMSKNTMDEIIQAEDMLLHPERYLEQTISVNKKNANAIKKVQIKKIQEEAARIIDQISAKHLPNDILEKTAGNVKAQIKALIDLNSENKLTNVNYLTDKSQPIKTGGDRTIKIKTVVNSDQNLLNNQQGRPDTVEPVVSSSPKIKLSPQQPEQPKIKITVGQTNQTSSGNLPQDIIPQTKLSDIENKVYGSETKLGDTGNKENLGFIGNKLRSAEIKANEVVSNGLTSQNKVVRGVATLFQDLFGGAGKSQEQLSQKSQFRGGTDYATKIAGDTQNYVYNLLNNDTKSLERVHSVLDPEISKIKIDEGSLTANEKEALKMVREVSDFINDTNHRLGFISDELWQKNRGGKYLARAYETFDYPPEVADFIKNKSLKFDLNPFKKRTEMTDWKKENAITDPAYLIGKRLQQTLFNSEVKKYTDWAMKSGLISDTQKAGYVQLSDSKAYGEAAGKWIRKDALEDIKGFFVSNDIGQKAYDILNWYDRNPLRRGQKMLKTVFNPAVRLGNRTGNYVFAWLNGINPVTFAKNKSWAKNAINSNDPIYRYAIQNGITGSDITKADITRISAELKRGVNDINTLQKINAWAKESYGRVDDVSKVAAFKTWLDRGVSPQEALNRTRRGFQDYNMVGMLYDLGAKIPILGNPFVRFASESIRITKNAAVDHPFRLVATLGAWKLFTDVMSRMSGEDEKDRKTRESRVGASHLPFTNISTNVQTPYGEINASRLLGFSSTFTPEDTGKLGSLGTDISKYAPFQNPLDARNYTNDPIIGPVISLAIDKDFRGKSIADPKQNKYTGSLLTPGEQNLNRLGYAARSYLPPSFTDLYNIGASVQGKENVYGQVKTPLQSILRTYPGIKIEQFGPKEAEATRQRNADYNAYELDYIQKQINAVKKQQAEGKITPQQAQKRIDSLNREKITSQSDGERTFETSPEAPKDIMERISLATKATVTNPTNALKVIQAIFTEEKMRKLSGDTLIFERETNLNKTKEKGDAVDHIIPLSLGGDNSDKNKRYISAEANQEKAKLETSLARKLANNEITGKEARKQIKNFMDKYSADFTPTTSTEATSETTTESTGKIYKITNKETGKDTEIDLTFPEYPKLTGLTEADKALKSSYYSALSKIKTNATKLYNDGQLKAEEYNDILTKVSTSKSKSGSGKTKSKGGKITIAKTPEAKVIKIKLPTIKLPQNTLKSNIKVKKPSIAQLKKRRTIKIKV